MHQNSAVQRGRTLQAPAKDIQRDIPLDQAPAVGTCVFLHVAMVKAMLVSLRDSEDPRKRSRWFQQTSLHELLTKLQPIESKKVHVVIAAPAFEGYHEGVYKTFFAFRLEEGGQVFTLCSRWFDVSGVNAHTPAPTTKKGQSQPN